MSLSKGSYWPLLLRRDCDSVNLQCLGNWLKCASYKHELSLLKCEVYSKWSELLDVTALLIGKISFPLYCLRKQVASQLKQTFGGQDSGFFCPMTTNPKCGSSTLEGGVVSVKMLSLGRTVRGWGFVCLQNFPHLSLPLGLVPHYRSTIFPTSSFLRFCWNSGFLLHLWDFHTLHNTLSWSANGGKSCC